MNSTKTNFFDTRTLISMALMVMVFLGWQRYMQTKYPDAYRAKDQVAATSPGAAVTPVPNVPVPAAAPGTPVSAPSQDHGEALTHVVTDTMAFDISSKGLGLANFKLPRYLDRRGEIVEMGSLGAGPRLLETKLLNSTADLNFAVTRQSDLVYIGRAESGGLKITKSIEIQPDTYTLRFKVSVVGEDPHFAGLTTSLYEQLDSPTKGNLLLPQLEKQEFFVEAAAKTERLAFKKEDFGKSWDKVKLASIGSQYFTAAILDDSPVMPEAKAFVDHTGDRAAVLLNYGVLNPGKEFNLDYRAYVGPKSFSLLNAIDPTLAGVVDYGFFNFIARYIFWLLQHIYFLVGNWGVAIVGMTLVVRACLLPFNIYSFRSMRAMQAIQPRIAKMKERYKDDPQKANGEVMRLMRENKVNPLGGCLPVLLQFPVFFALYQMLGHTIELYQAPFTLWIHDLSLKDPYYVLPVLMGITMFIQQKTTPNASMDPNQAKILMMMPLIFTFFMISLPSGLALYMLVGAIFSVVQQTIMTKSKTTSVALT